VLRLTWDNFGTDVIARPQITSLKIRDVRRNFRAPDRAFSGRNETDAKIGIKEIEAHMIMSPVTLLEFPS
jgi:hypothetical protein